MNDIRFTKFVSQSFSPPLFVLYGIFTIHLYRHTDRRTTHRCTSKENMLLPSGSLGILFLVVDEGNTDVLVLVGVLDNEFDGIIAIVGDGTDDVIGGVADGTNDDIIDGNTVDDVGRPNVANAAS